MATKLWKKVDRDAIITFLKSPPEKAK